MHTNDAVEPLGHKLSEDIVMYLIFIIIFCSFFVSSCAVAGGADYNNSLELKHNNIKPIISIGHDWESLLESSSLVITGKVAEILYVVDETKMYEHTQLPKETKKNQLIYLPNLREGVKGTLVRIKIDQVIYVRKDVKVGKTIDIYISGGYLPPTDTSIPTFTNEGEYLVFLSGIEQLDDPYQLKIIQPLDLKKGGIDFDVKSAFSVIHPNGAHFPITGINKHIVDDLKLFIKTTK